MKLSAEAGPNNNITEIMKTHSFFATITAGCASLLLLAACNSDKEKTPDDHAPVPIDVARAVTDSVTVFKNIPGKLMALDMVDIVARVDGYLRSIDYQSGQVVKKGQLLFTIEDTQYRDAVNQASASLASARSSYQYAQAHYAALQKALQSDAVSQMEVRQALSAVEQARASISAAEAALQTARTNLSYCRVYAPFTGRITASTPSVGAYLAGAAAPVTLATIYKDSEMQAYFTIEDQSFLRGFTDEAKRSALRYDSIPIIFTEQLPHKYYGDLRYLAPDVDTSTGTMQLRADIANPYGELREGMYVSVDFPLSVDPKAVLVKDASISTDQLGKYLYTVNDSNKVVCTHIEVGSLVHDTMRVVTSGLKAGDTYVTKALLKVRPGMVVKPVYSK